ncbi:MAG: hypothetical protein AAB576_04130, partial [Elusimicrobiota bacterium]
MLVEAQGGGCVSLRVHIDEQSLVSQLGEGGGQINCCGGFSDPPLLVGDGDDLAHCCSDKADAMAV